MDMPPPPPLRRGRNPGRGSSPSHPRRGPSTEAGLHPSSSNVSSAHRGHHSALSNTLDILQPSRVLPQPVAGNTPMSHPRRGPSTESGTQLSSSNVSSAQLGQLSTTIAAMQPSRVPPQPTAGNAPMNQSSANQLPPQTRLQLEAALRALPADAAVCDQMIALLSRVREDMALDYEEKHNELRREMLAIQSVVDRMNDSFVRFAIGAKSKELGLASKKRKSTEPPSEMEHVDILINPDQGMEEHLVFLLLVSVTSFAMQHQEFKCWLDPTTLRRMMPYQEIMQGTSGMGITYFGSVKDLGIRRYQTRVAALWSLVLRFVLARKVGLTKKWLSAQASNYGRNPAAHIPPWLKAFGNFTDTYKIVDLVVSVEENTDRPFLSSTAGSSTSRGSSSSRDRSTRRSQESVAEHKRKKMGLNGHHDKTLELVVYAVLQMRSHFLGKLTTARNEARKILFKDLLFLVEKIARYESLDAAEDDGCWIKFVSNRAPSDQRQSSISPDQLWKIDLCECVDASDDEHNKAEKWKRNRIRFEKMPEKFPFLSIVLHWRRYATNPANRNSDYLPMTKSLSLYKVAGDFLLAAYKYEDFDELLSLSDLSLRALHLHAVGIYALLRKFCGFDLCDVESSCLGHVTWMDLSSCLDEINGGSSSALASAPLGPRPPGGRALSASDIQDYPVTAMYGGGTNVESENEERPSLLVSYRKDKFEFSSCTAFVEEKRERENIARNQDTGAESSRAAFNVGGASEMDIGCDNLDWPGRSGREV